MTRKGGNPIKGKKWYSNWQKARKRFMDALDAVDTHVHVEKMVLPPVETADMIARTLQHKFASRKAPPKKEHCAPTWGVDGHQHLVGDEVRQLEALPNTVTQIEMAGTPAAQWRVTIEGRALQRLKVDTKAKLGNMKKACDAMATDYTDPGERSIRGRGEDISHPGTRRRFKAPCASDRVIASAACKAGQEKKAKAILVDVQCVCNSALLSAAQWDGGIVRQMVEEIEEVWGRSGTASFAHLSVSLGYKAGATVHVDKGDVHTAVWAALGDYEMYLPEIGCTLKIRDGDVLTFPSHTVWHCLMGVPTEHLDDEPDNICCSLYSNKRQLKEFREEAAKCQGKRKLGECADHFQTTVSEYEQQRRRNIARNEAFLRNLGLVN